MIKESITIINQLGLHARAAAKLVSTAGRYSCKVSLEKDGQEVNGKSIMSVMMLAASCGTEIMVITEGEDEQAAFDDLKALINDKFGEEQ